MWTKQFWKATAERACKTFAQFLLVIYGASLFDVFAFDWHRALGLSLGGLVVSVVTSLGSAFVGPNGPSLTSERVVSAGRHTRPE